MPPRLRSQPQSTGGSAWAAGLAARRAARVGRVGGAGDSIKHRAGRRSFHSKPLFGLHPGKCHPLLQIWTRLHRDAAVLIRPRAHERHRGKAANLEQKDEDDGFHIALKRMASCMLMNAFCRKASPPLMVFCVRVASTRATPVTWPVWSTTFLTSTNRSATR